MTRYLLWLYYKDQVRLEVYNTYEKAKLQGEFALNTKEIYYKYDRYKIEKVEYYY